MTPTSAAHVAVQKNGKSLAASYLDVRQATEALCKPLQTEDYCIQTMADVSPTKWHLAHTSWFFETVVLKPHLADYREFHPRYAYLFNSYYESFGKRHARPHRGILSRPSVGEIFEYRAYVDQHIQPLLESSNKEILRLIEIGLNHEQQHQELMLTDIKHVFASNPLLPAYIEHEPVSGVAVPMQWLEQPEGIREIGHGGAGFAYDNETPRHRVWLDAYRMASRPVTNAEYLAFMEDRGYETATLWLSDAWDVIREQAWQAPLYWENRDGNWWHYSLQGSRPVQADEPVTHLSFYEADAYARWANARLPTEPEWEAAASQYPILGDFVGNGLHHPRILSSDAPGTDSSFFYGGVWEWTSSAYGPYPGYQSPDGALGEYNAKFMCNQLILRGGSCATPRSHIRPSYRNFFYPQQRWQFTGLRLARNA